MSTETEVIGIAELHERQPGDKDNPVWINEDVKALVASIKAGRSKANKPYWSVSLTDETAQQVRLSLSLFSAPMFGEGDLILIGGNGRRLTSFNNHLQIAVAQGTTFTVLQRGGAKPAPSAPVASSRPPPLAGSSTTPGEPITIYGATVGAALKVACEIVASIPELTPGTSDYWRGVWIHASDYIRLAQKLERGGLAPNVRERESGVPDAPLPAPEPEPTPPPAASTKPRPGPNDSAFDPASIEDEDVPF